MPYYVRKVRNQDKYRVCFKDDKSSCSLFQFETKDEAYQKMRDEIYKRVEEEKQHDIINSSSENSDSDTEITEV